MKLKNPTASLCGSAVFALATAITPSGGQVAVDGVLTPGEGYSSLAVQDQVTQWGATNSLANIQTEQTTKLLNLFVAGRVDGNAMIVFVDSKPGGVSFIGNTLIQSGGFEADINNLGDTSTSGMTFEPGFEPDYAIRIFGTGVEAYASLYDLQKQFRADLGRVDTSGGAAGSHGPVVAISTEWEDVTVDADTSDPDFVKYTLPSGPTAPDKLFVRLEVLEVVE